MSQESSESSKTDGKDVATLSELFDKGFDLFNEINKTEEPTNSTKIQCDIKRAMSMFEDATRLVSLVDMFSENETFDEIATENVKYLLLPALLGTLATKISNIEDRMHIVDVAEIYFTDFLKRVKAYGLTDVNIPGNTFEQEEERDAGKSRSNAETITEMVNRRNAKLQRYKEQKELESRLEILRKNLSNLNIDDELKREYFVTLVKLYVNLAIDELGMLASEKPILLHKKSLGKTDSMVSESKRKHKSTATVTKLQPIIITKDELQKKVYGAGYPSLPVLTVQEFYDQRVKEGIWPDPATQNQGKSLQEMANTVGKPDEEEEAAKEELVDKDDTDHLNKLRAMDEYKDTHRRGWGNRANRS